MRTTSSVVLGVCRKCYLCLFQQRTFAAVAKSPQRSVPLRIFETEVDPESALPNDRNKRAEESRRSKERHSRKPSPEYVEQMSSAERLSNELRYRLGRHPPKGLVEAANAVNSREGLRLSSRMPTRPAPSPTESASITATDLIQKQEDRESEETIFAAIERCIATAIERLELYAAEEPICSLQKGRITVPYDQFSWLSTILQFQFTKTQLVNYGQRSGLSKTRLHQAKMSDAIDIILDKVWNLEKGPELPSDEALVTKSKPSML